MVRSEPHAMFLHAHPDDESSKGAATMAKYAKEGARVSVVTFTDGAAGDVLNPALADDVEIPARMVDIRKEELAAALSILGVTDHFDLRFPDSGYVEDFNGDGSVLPPDCFYNAPTDDVLAKLVPIIRETRPQVLVTYDEEGGYPHPDHVRTHSATMAAWRAAADPAVLPEAGPAWRASKVYYHQTFTYDRLSRLQDACEERGIETPFARWLEKWERDVRRERVTTKIDVTDHLATGRHALRAHRTQVDPDGPWFAIPDDLVREVWPYEDFRLAHSEVATDRPEHDLFAGL